MTVIVIFGPNVSEIEELAEPESLSLYLAAPVIAMFLLGIADAAVWPFSAEIGKSLGLTDGDAELVLAAALGAGVVGAGLASVLSGVRRSWPVLLATALLALAYVGVLSGESITIYSGSQISVLLFFGFVATFVLGLAGELDRTGSMMAAASGAQMIGFGMSPWLAGLIISSFGAGVLSALVAFSILTVIPFYIIGKRKLVEQPE